MKNFLVRLGSFTIHDREPFIPVIETVYIVKKHDGSYHTSYEREDIDGQCETIAYYDIITNDGVILGRDILCAVMAEAIKDIGITQSSS